MLTEVSVHPQPEDSRVTPSMEGNKEIQCVSPEKDLIEFEAQQGKKYLIVPEKLSK
jgi:hypothetical protein